MQTHTTHFDYRTTFAVIPTAFPNHECVAEDLSRISPKPPKGQDWQLVSSTTVQTTQGSVVLYFWERPSMAPSERRQF